MWYVAFHFRTSHIAVYPKPSHKCFGSFPRTCYYPFVNKETRKKGQIGKPRSPGILWWQLFELCKQSLPVHGEDRLGSEAGAPTDEILIAKLVLILRSKEQAQLGLVTEAESSWLVCWLYSTAAKNGNDQFNKDLTREKDSLLKSGEVPSKACSCQCSFSTCSDVLNVRLGWPDRPPSKRWRLVVSGALCFAVVWVADTHIKVLVQVEVEDKKKLNAPSETWS